MQKYTSLFLEVKKVMDMNFAEFCETKVIHWGERYVYLLQAAI